MSTEAAPAPDQPRRLPRPKWPDVLIVLFVAVLALAVVVNGVTDVHDVRRARLDKKVASAWFRSHPQLGQFGPPTVIVHQRRDFACSAKKPPAGIKNPVEGLCLSIADTSQTSTNILFVFKCRYLRPGQSAKGINRCPPRHGNSVTG